MMIYMHRRKMMGKIPDMINRRISSVNFISEIATKNKDGKAK